MFSLILRGSQATSCLTFSGAMQPLYIIIAALSSLCFLSSVFSIKCNYTQYSWPLEAPKWCCNKCAPGEHMARRPEKSCEIKCCPCTGNRYSDSYNVDMTCTVCKSCQKENMEYLSHCNTTHNAVCRCKTGYRCTDQSCTQCVNISTTSTPTVPTSTTSSTTETPTTTHTPKIRDTVWFLVIIVLLCAGIAAMVVTKIKPFLRWIMSKHGYFLTEKPAPESECSEDEEVSKPVQEVCGKCDQPIDV